MDGRLLIGLTQDVRLYRSIQKLRLGIGERIRSVEQGRSERLTGRDEEWFAGLQAIENNVKKSVEAFAKQHPLYAEWLIHVRGIGPLNCAQLMGEIASVKGHNGQPGIGAFDTVSSLWKFSGLVPGQKPVKGEKLSYNSRLKTIALEHVGSSFIRSNSPYRRIYDDKKAYYQANRTDWPKLRIHYAARRAMVKVFLSHFWEQWRALEGYETRALYVIEHLGHTHEYRWPEFVGDGLYDDEDFDDTPMTADEVE